MDTATTSRPPLRLMLLDSPRTTCQVFYKLWQSHPQIAWGRFNHGFSGYQIHGPDRFSRKLHHSEEVSRALEAGWVKPYSESEGWQWMAPPNLEGAQGKFVEAVEGSEGEGKVFYGKEHVLCLLKQEIMLDVLRGEGDSVPVGKENPTFVPDDLIQTLTPLMIIRHPQLIIDSAWRSLTQVVPIVPGDEVFEFQTTLKWTRILYDYFVNQLGITPTVIDSEDFVYHTKAVTDRLCGLWGLDPEGVRETWDPVPEAYQPRDDVTKVFVGHVMRSQGMESGEKPPSTDLPEQVEKWTGLYGEDVAAGLKKRVENEMETYEYLRARNLVVRGMRT